MTSTGCSIAECPRPAKSRGLCNTHYERWRLHGSTDQPTRKRPPRPCSYPGCSEPHFGQGYCVAHYSRWRRSGSPEPRATDQVTLFWQKVTKTDSCWAWTGAMLSNGYGSAWFDKRTQLAHRIAYSLCVAPIAPGAQIDHLCRNRACVNPAHLEPVTQRENIRRGEASSAHALRTDCCIRGHEFTPENTYRSKGGRHCRTCRQMASRRYKARRASTSRLSDVQIPE